MFRTLLSVLVLLQLGSCGISNIPTFDQAVNQAWNEVQSQYQRRVELVPTLLDTLLPLNEQESELLKALRDAEALVQQTNVSPETLTDSDAFSTVADSQAKLTRELQKIAQAMDNYPELRDSAPYVEITTELADIKNRIDVARRDYIQKVERYNRELHSVPGKWWRAFMYPDAQRKESFE